MSMETPEKHYPVFCFMPGGDFAKPQHQLGVSYIRAMLKDVHGVASTQIVPDQWENAGGYIRLILESNPTLVGFTVYDNNILVTSTVSQAIRKSLPDVPIVFGGPTSTFSANECLRLCPWVDCCVVGEAEYTLPELLDHYGKYGRHSAPVDIAGVYYRRDGETHYVGDRPLAGMEVGGATVLDVLPSPYISGILDAHSQTGIITSRGCVYRCTYCNFTAMSRYRIRYHSPERVIAELESIARTAKNDAQRSVTFQDDAFALDIKRGKQILQGIIDADLGLRFACLARADRVDDEFMEMLTKAGFFYIGFGLESSDPEVLRLVKKVGTGSDSEPDFKRELEYVDTIRRKVEVASKLGLETDVSLIMGLPGDTEQTAQKTLDDVHSMPCTIYTHNVLTLYPGTELFNTCSQHGMTLVNPELGPPYTVKYAYPVEQLKFSKRSKTAVHSINLTMRLGRILSTISSGGSRLSDASPGVISLLSWQDLVEDAPFIRNTVSQLGTFIRLSGKDNSDFDLRRDESIYCISRLNYFGTENGEPLLRNDRSPVVLRSLRTFIGNYYPIMEFVPYANCEDRSEPFMGGTGEPFNIRIATFFAPMDIKQLFEDLSSTDNLQQALADILAKCDFFTDSCKWAKSPCRGQATSGLAVDERGEQRVCYSCPGFRRWMDVSKIADFMKDAVEKVRKKRGCKDCRIKDQCSCCPFPDPLSEEEFCEMNRQFAVVRPFLSLGPLDYALRRLI